MILAHSLILYLAWCGRRLDRVIIRIVRIADLLGIRKLVVHATRKGTTSRVFVLPVTLLYVGTF